MRTLVGAPHGIVLITSLITGQRLCANICVFVCVWGGYLSNVCAYFTLAIYIYICSFKSVYISLMRILNMKLSHF